MFPRKQEFQSYKVNFSPREEIQPEEIFFDNSKLKEFEKGEVETGKVEHPISQLVFFSFELLIASVLIAVAGFTGFRTIDIKKNYTAQAQANFLRATPIFAERGIIYSPDGETLAQNEIYYDLVVNSPQLPLSNDELERLSKKIADALNLTFDDIYIRLLGIQQKRFSETVLLKGISAENLAKVKDYIADFSFMEVRQVARRKYPYGPAFAHILGYTGEVQMSNGTAEPYFQGERVGKSGIESAYDDALRGKTGFFTRKVDAKGNTYAQELPIEAHAGKSVTLNIHVKLQERVYDILERHMRALKIESAAAILLDPRNGRVLSMVSFPSFDNNIFESGVSQEEFNDLLKNSAKPLFNRVISGEYPSGSTIKPLIAAAALEEKLVSPDFLIYSAGSIYVPSVYNRDVVYEFKDWKKHGWSDMRKALADSVNIYFYTIAGGYKDQEGLGIKKIEEYLQKFGWGESTGIDLPGERIGQIPSPKWKKEKKGENWYVGDTYLTSIGQGDMLVTPLQVAAATMIFANQGTLFKSQIIRSIDGAEIEPKILSKNFISAENIEVVRDGLRRAVTSGSSRNLADLPISVAGKTGTAQTGNVLNHAWFTGFAPYENPEIVVTVLLESGDSSNYAVRAAKDILLAYFEIYPQ